MTADADRAATRSSSRWLTEVNPLVDFALSETGELTFANAAEQAGVATDARSYRLQWARFDNATSQTEDVGNEMAVSEKRAQAPSGFLSQGSAPEFVQVRLAAVHAQFPSWATPVTVYFQRQPRGWRLVGLDRDRR